MNERIRQLALEAFQPINDIASEGIADRYTFDQAWFQMYNQKFAELIVRECADIAREIGNNTEPDDFALDRCYEIEDQIMKHFGVEEC